ncbi:MAG: hypothetical protein GY803_32045 [Chloroflexi bacterium]|nr:hypothetical protein [Chloroflexota bacterium]
MMNDTIAAMSTQDFETLIEQIIDRRMRVWATQLLDALGREEDSDEAELQSDFAASLERSIQQAQTGNLTNLHEFRQQLASERL